MLTISNYIIFLKNQTQKTGNGSKLVIPSVNLNATGTYKCEISEEGSFHTDSKESYMLVLGKFSWSRIVGDMIKMQIQLQVYFFLIL